MPGNAAKVTTSERQQIILSEIRRSKSESPMFGQRAAIILLAFEGRLNEDIAQEVQLDRKQVGLWRRRWQAAWPALTTLECTDPRRLREAIRETLRDAPRAGAKGKFTAEQISQILALACEPPSKSERPITHWTHRELCDEILKRNIVDSISVSRVGAILRESALQPHRRKMWLNTKEKDPKVFQEQVETVCRTYAEAGKLSEERGTHTISNDEMTGVQALERTAPTQPMEPGQVAREEFEYERHGTTTMIANLDVVTGEVTATLGPTRTEEDYQNHIEKTIQTDPTGEWIFVVDQLNIHLSASLVILVAMLCGITEDLGKKVATAF
jgi:transposase